jgi:microcin C transport system permease protein
MKYHGRVYVPMIFSYHPTEFGIEDQVVTDYRGLEMKDGDWWVWPLVQWDPFESNKVVESYPSKPTGDNIFGTDDRGRDVFTRLLYGFRYTISFAVGSWLLTYFVGVSLGALMGYLGGNFDLVMNRISEVVETMPIFFVLITMNSIFTPNVALLCVFMAVLNWTGIAAHMRGQFLSLRKREYVEAAKAIGSSDSRIIFKHILPNAITPIVTFAPFAIAGGVSALSFLDYLGLGLTPPTPSWGELIGQAQKYFSSADWLVWAPSGALVLTLSLLMGIGSGVRNAYDSKA